MSGFEGGGKNNSGLFWLGVGLGILGSRRRRSESGPSARGNVGPSGTDWDKFHRDMDATFERQRADMRSRHDKTFGRERRR